MPRKVLHQEFGLQVSDGGEIQFGMHLKLNLPKLPFMKEHVNQNTATVQNLNFSEFCGPIHRTMFTKAFLQPNNVDMFIAGESVHKNENIRENYIQKAFY